MKTISLYTALITVAFGHSLCFGQGYSLLWRTNNVSVAFADQDLTPMTKSAIVVDLQNCFRGWATNAEIRLVSNGEVTNYVYYGTRTPCYPEGVDFPKTIVINASGGIALQIPKTLSDAYTNAFAFAAANPSIVTAAYEFVQFVSSTNFYSVTSNQISEYVLYNQAPPVLYQLGYPDITNSLRYSTYYPPSILGFHYRSAGPDPTNLWLFVPSSSHPYGNVIEWYPSPAIWHNGKWKFCIWEDNPRYEFPE